jgi:hypothetical protein
LNGLSNGFTGAYNAAFVCAAAGSTGSCLIQVGGGSTSYTNIGIYHETTGILSSINYNFSTNVIYNLALARSSGVLTAYVNGTAIGSTTTTNLYDFNKGGNFIGRHYFGGYEQYFKGNVYSLQAYSRGLSSTEILQNYNATKKRFLPEENIVTNGLVFNIDASKSSSYAGLGNTIYDISGSGKIGTLTNGPTFSGLNGGSIAFDGSNDYILFPNSDVMGSVYTQNIWFKKNSLSVSDLADAQYSGALVNSGSISYYYTNVPPYFLQAYYNFVIGVWYCVSLVRGSSTKEIYLNGNILASIGSTDMYDAPGTNFVIGSNGGNSEFLNGNIAQVQIYNRALTQQEITQNYNAVKNRFGLS